MRLKIIAVIFLLFLSSDSFSGIVNLLDSLKLRLDYSTGKERIEIMTIYGRLYAGNYKDSGILILRNAIRESAENGYQEHLVKAYIQIANIFSAETYYDSAFYYTDKALYLSTQLNNELLIGNSYSMLGNLYLVTDNYKQSYYYLMKADSILNNTIPSEEYCENTIQLSRILRRLSEEVSAISYLMKAIDVAEKNNYRDLKADLYNRLAYIYKTLEDKNNTELFLNKALETSLQINYQRGVADSYQNYGDFHTDITGDLNEARNYYEKSLNLYSALGLNSAVSTLLTKLSHIYMLQNNLPRALELSKMSLDYRQKAGRNELIGSSLINIGNIYLQMNNFSAALKYLLDGISRVNNTDLKGRGYEILYKTNLGMNNYKAALENYKIYIDLKDSIRKMESFKSVSQIELKYELEKNMRDIEKIKYDLQTERLTYAVIFSIALLLATIIATIAFLAKRKLNLRLQKINIDNERIIEERTAELKKEISVRKKAEKDLQEALEKEKYLGELKSRFVSMVSHEFRTPLTGIETSADLLKMNIEKTGDTAKHKKYINRIYNELNRLTTLLDDILLFGRTDSGKIKFSPIETDLITLINNLIKYLKRNNKNFIPPENIIIKGNKRKIFCDQNMMETILTNLFSNANKYSPADAKWSIEINFDDNYCEIYISDNGIGIPENEISFLFESFFRGSNTAGIPGTGIGLVTVKQMVDEHNGQISVRNNKDKGVTFTLKLPYN